MKRLSITKALPNLNVCLSAKTAEEIQTYISRIFLTDKCAYKIKKPVNYGYLDFTTLEKRRVYCEREVDLNHRLCPDVYIGVVPLKQREDGYCIGGKGEVVEYAVWMERLPQDRMLDVLLTKKEVTPDMMVAVAEKVAEFHEKAQGGSGIGSFGMPAELQANALENFTQTRDYIDRTLSMDMFLQILKNTTGFLLKNRELFYQRIEDDRIKDCHGDLHSQHICFADGGIQIFDCIEFNDKFRYCDVASEVAFLAMDLDFHGREDLSRIFVDAYVRASGDAALLKLLDFYKCYRAYVRGKVNCFRLDDPHIPPDERDEALENAKRYFALAYSYTGGTDENI